MQDFESFTCEINEDLILFRRKRCVSDIEERKPSQCDEDGNVNSLDFSHKLLRKENTGIEDLFQTPGYPERRLLLVIVGHNPSSYSWNCGHYYANPSNYMWKLLVNSNLVPSHFTAQNDYQCPHNCGIGFADLAVGISETISANLKMEKLRRCKQSFYERLVSHCERVSINGNISVESCAPKVIAFAGKRQWQALFPNRKCDAFSYGFQTNLPQDWPKPLSQSLVFLLPSTSGAAAMKREERCLPYRDLGKFVNDLQKVCQ